MGKKDYIGAFFWLILALFILKEARLLRFGSFSRPGPGLFPFVIGIILGILSLIFLVKSWLGEKREREDLRFLLEKGGGKRTSLILVSMFVFYLIFESVGFIITSFLLMLILIKFIEPHNKWIYSAWISALISVSSYLFFQILLKVNLPKGVMKGLGF